MLAARWRAHGVDVRLGTSVARFHTDAGGRVEAVRLDDGTDVRVDAVLVGVGVEPARELLPAAPVPGLHLAGDVAGSGHWTAAAHDGVAAAHRILGLPAPRPTRAVRVVGPVRPAPPDRRRLATRRHGRARRHRGRVHRPPPRSRRKHARRDLREQTRGCGGIAPVAGGASVVRMNADRLRVVLFGALVVVAAGAAAITLNVLLLDRTTNRSEPVGRLTPRVHLPAAPAWTIRPRHGPIEDGGADD